MADVTKTGARGVRHPVRRRLRVLLGITLAAVQGVAMVGVALLLWARTPVGREHVRATIERQVQRRIPGFHVGGVGGSWPPELTLANVSVNDASGRPAVRIAAARARVDLRALLSRRVRLDRLAVVAPRVWVRRLEDGGVNLAGLVTPAPVPDSTAAWPVEIRDFTITNGVAEYVDAGLVLTVSGLRASGSAWAGAGEVAASLQVGARVRVAGQELALDLGAAGALVGDVLALRVGRLEVRGLMAAGPVTLRGVVNGTLAGLRVAAEGTVPGGAPAQVAGTLGLDGAPTYDLTAHVSGLDPRTLAGAWPAGQLTLTAHAAGRGLPLTPGATARVALHLRRSRIAALEGLTGRVTADLDGHTWRLRALTAEVPGLVVSARGHGVDERLELELTAALTRPRAIAYLPRGLYGQAQLRAHAVVALPDRLERLQAHLHATRAGFAGTSVGSLDLDVDAAGPLRLPRGEARLRAFGVQVRPNAPRLDRLTLVASNRQGRLRVAGRAAGAAVSGTVAAHGVVTARGARVTVAELRARYGAYSFALRQPAEVRWQRDRLVAVHGLRAATLGGEISASGTYRTSAGASPWLEAHVVARHLDVERVPVPLDADVTLALTRDRLTAAGTLDVGGTRPITLAAGLPLRPGRGLRLPRLAARGAVDVHLVAVGLPLRVVPPELRARAGLSAGSADLRVDVTGDVGAPQGRLAARLHGVAAAGFTGLDAATDVTSVGREVRVTMSAGVNGARLLEAQGRTRLGLPAWHGLARLPLTADVAVPGFDLARLRGARPQLVALAGVLTGKARITGTVDHPRVAGELAVAGAAIKGVPFARLTARAESRGAAFAVDVVAQQQAGGSLHARLTRASAVRASLRVQRFDLAFLQPLVPHLEQVGGYLEGYVTLEGSLSRPRLQGTVALRRGSLTVTDAPPFQEVELRLRVANDQLHVDSLTAKVGGGSVALVGRARLGGWVPSSWQAQLKLRRLPIAYETVSGSSLDADVAVTGELAGRRARVTVHVAKGLLTMPRLEGGRQLWSTEPLAGVSFVGEPAAKAPVAVVKPVLPRDVRVAVNVDAFRVRGPDLDVGVKARLALHTEKGELLIGGNIEVDRGTISLFGNRYKLARTRIVWDGSANPDPALDMRLSHRFADAKVMITVRGTVRQPDISFASDPPLYSKAEIVSLIVTGEAADTADSSGDATTNAISTIATTLVRDLTGRIAPFLPVDVVRVQQLTQGQLQQAHQTQLPSQMPSGQVTRLEIGKRLTRRIRISYVHVFGVNQDENANEAHVELRLSPRWVLQSEYGDAGVGGLDLLWRRRY